MNEIRPGQRNANRAGGCQLMRAGQQKQGCEKSDHLLVRLEDVVGVALGISNVRLAQ